MFKKSKAFTLVEIMLTLSIIAVIAILTIGNKGSAEARRLKKNVAVSQSFHYNLISSYQNMVLRPEYRGSAANIPGANAKKKSENVKNALLRYLDGENYDCANIKKIAKSKESASFINNDISCFITPAKVMGAVYFDTKCTNKYTIKETCDMEDFTSRKQVEKSCGYILYGLTDSQGEYGKDLFTIALGARNVKK